MEKIKFTNIVKNYLNKLKINSLLFSIIKKEKFDPKFEHTI